MNKKKQQYIKDLPLNISSTPAVREYYSWERNTAEYRRRIRYTVQSIIKYFTEGFKKKQLSEAILVLSCNKMRQKASKSNYHVIVRWLLWQSKKHRNQLLCGVMIWIIFKGNIHNVAYKVNWKYHSRVWMCLYLQIPCPLGWGEAGWAKSCRAERPASDRMNDLMTQLLRYYLCGKKREGF